MRQRFVPRLLAIFALLTIVGASPTLAHEEHRRQREAALKAERLRQSQAAVRPGIGAPAAADPAALHAQMGEMAEMPKVDRSRMAFIERLMDWIGRMHPIIVHFPIAFFPAALFTAVVGRHRPAFAAPVQFLVIAGGIIAPIAAILGWIDGGFTLATDDWLLSTHRWLGTAIGLGALGLGVWAWRKPGANRGTAMIACLSVVTIAIVIQGWFGGALVHGADHMNW